MADNVYKHVETNMKPDPPQPINFKTHKPPTPLTWSETDSRHPADFKIIPHYEPLTLAPAIAEPCLKRRSSKGIEMLQYCNTVLAKFDTIQTVQYCNREILIL